MRGEPVQRLIGSLLLATLLATMLVANVAAYAPGEGAFRRTWERTDKPVKDLVVQRTWMWGPEANTPVFEEEYAEAPGGKRLVQYFDKSRMEINHDPNVGPNSLWHVTNGLLVVELMTGQMQVGDTKFVPRAPSQTQIAGDWGDPNAPTYATFATLRDDAPHPAAQHITAFVDRDGNVSYRSEMNKYGVTFGHHVQADGINHKIAQPFWYFMTMDGLVSKDGKIVSEKLFDNPFYATGYPITEAYWVNVLLDGKPADVLTQCFERRCLTYNPLNQQGWNVEAGNVGQHYYQWRHGSANEELASVYLVAFEDGGKNGIPVGCGDSLISVRRAIEPSDDVTVKVRRTLESLFAIDDLWYGESGYASSLHASDLTVQSVTVANGHATVALSGSLVLSGACDEPRASGQIFQTILHVPGISSALITLNGQTLNAP
jgi:hypothetical protein